MKKNTGYTLWTIPKQSWSKLLDDVQITEELASRIREDYRDLNQEKEDRLKPYDTPLTEETLRQVIG